MLSDKKTVKALEKNLEFIKERIGFDGKKIIPNSYLDKISVTPEVKSEIADYMTNSIANKSSYKNLSKGFKELIKGTPDSSGLLERYHNQYTFDTFNQVDESLNKVFAESLGVDQYFLYGGTVMKRTRPFCRERAGNVYTVEEAKKWNSLEFQGKSTPYNFFIDRGGYNCRHSINYITKEVYEFLGGTEK
jgi:hypothetical protein